MAGLTRAEKAARDRLPNRLAVAALVKTFPRHLVDAAIEETGAQGQRSRALPAWLTAYLAMAMWIWPNLGYGSVLGNLVDGLRWAHPLGWDGWKMPSTGSITKARARLDWPVMAALFARTADQIHAHPPQSTAGLNVCTIDRFCLTAPDTPENRRELTRTQPPPHVAVTTAADVSTGALVDAVVGNGTETIAKLWNHQPGRELIWRADLLAGPPVDDRLNDGTYRASLELGGRSTPVRVIDDAVHYGDNGYEPIQLVTTLTDPSKAPAIQLVDLYTRRWPVAATMHSIKQTPPGSTSLRSQTPDVAYQEVWALLCVYQATNAALRRSTDRQQQPPNPIARNDTIGNPLTRQPHPSHR